MEKDLIKMATGVSGVLLLFWEEVKDKNVYPQGKKKKKNAVKWNIPGLRDKEALKHLNILRQQCLKAWGDRGLKGSRRHRWRPLSAAAPTSTDRKAPAHVSRSRLFSLSVVETLLLFSPCGCHIERSHFICQPDRDVGVTIHPLLWAAWGLIAKLQPSVTKA